MLRCALHDTLGRGYEPEPFENQALYRRAGCFHQAQLNEKVKRIHSLRRALGENTNAA